VPRMRLEHQAHQSPRCIDFLLAHPNSFPL
jgi:hypothetical protein